MRAKRQPDAPEVVDEASGTELERLARRISKIEDDAEIKRLRYKYHRYVNERMPERLSEILTEDAVFDFSGRIIWKGVDRIVEGAKAQVAQASIMIQFPHNVEVDIEGDEATMSSYMDARYGAEGKSLIVALRFEDKVRRTPSGWKIYHTYLKLIFSVPIQVGWAGEDLNYFTGVPGEVRPKDL